MNDTDLTEARSFHARLVDLLRVEFVSLGAFLEALAEFDRRKHFRALGHANLFAYLHRGLKLSRAAAHHRRAAAWLVQRFPVVLEPIREGKLCFTTAAVLASVATEENLARGASAILRPLQAGGPGTGGGAEAPEGGADEDGGDPGGAGRFRRVGPGELGMTRTEQELARVDRSSERPAAERTLVEPMTADASRMHVTVSPGVPGPAEEGEGGPVPRPAGRDRRAGADGGAGAAHRPAGEAAGLRCRRG